MSELASKCLSAVSGTAAKDYAMAISRFHRIQASPGYREAALFVADALSDMGYDVALHEFPADGRRVYLGGWRAPMGWEVTRGELRVVRPEEVELGRYPDVPTLVVAHSASRPEGVEAELVDVGTGVLDEEYGADVEGKFVLASGPARVVHEKAVTERGAVGLVLYRELLDAPDAVPYAALWPSADEVGRLGVAFSISYRQALRLKSMLRRGPVVLRGSVESRFFAGRLEVVEATLPGEADEYVLLIAHLCHPRPGAHDNASGSGLLLELARAAKELAEGGAKLALGLKFMWVPEFSGTVAYLEAREDVVRRVRAVVNLDMVGASQERTGGVVTVVGVSPFSPTFLPLLAYHALRECLRPLEHYGGRRVLPPLRLSLVPYAGGSDHHVFADPQLGVHVAAFIEWPDRYYHTSMDVADNLDPGVLRSVGAAALTAAACVASADDALIVESAHVCACVAEEYFSAKLVELLKSGREYASLASHKLAGWLADGVASLARLAGGREAGEAVSRVAEELRGRLERRAEAAVRDLGRVGSLKSVRLKRVDDPRVLRRARRCPLRLSDVIARLPRDKREALRRLIYVEKRRLEADVAYYLFDGRRSVQQVFEELYAFREDVDAEGFRALVDALLEAGWLEEAGGAKR